MAKKLAARYWLSMVTAALVILIIILARDNLVEAWRLLGQVNIWIFLLIIPVQFLSYYSGGAMVFSYLKSRGDLRNVSKLEQPKMALELNFVNHVFPSGGVSGASYMTYRLGNLGVNHGRATLAQVVKIAMTFVSFAFLMMIAVLLVTFDGGLTRFTILVASSLVSIIFGAILCAIFLVGSEKRLIKFADFLDNFLNKKIAKIFKRSKPIVNRQDIGVFLRDLHEDYKTLRREPKCLWRPFLWGIVFNIAETAMFFITFLALGSFVNPAPILIGLGMAGLIGTFLVTPGGIGGYEAAMILFLTTSGMPAAVATAGVLLTRTSLVLLTIASGYIFYSSAMKDNGRKLV